MSSMLESESSEDPERPPLQLEDRLDLLRRRHDIVKTQLTCQIQALKDAAEKDSEKNVTEMDQLRQRMEAVSGGMERLAEQMEDLELQMQSLDCETASWKMRLQDAIAEMEQLKTAIRNMEARVVHSNMAHDKLKQEVIDTVTADMRGSFQSYNANMSTLKMDLEEMRRQVSTPLPCTCPSMQSAPPAACYGAVRANNGVVGGGCTHASPYLPHHMKGGGRGYGPGQGFA
jgi:chromosome segregation ATPase